MHSHLRLYPLALRRSTRPAGEPAAQQRAFLLSGLFRLLAVFPLVFLLREACRVPHIGYSAL